MLCVCLTLQSWEKGTRTPKSMPRQAQTHFAGSESTQCRDEVLRLRPCSSGGFLLGQTREKGAPGGQG